MLHLPAALLAAALTLACGPKDGGGDTGGSDSSGGSASTSSGGSTSIPTQECTPGEDIDDSPGDCMECFCSDEGLIVCSRCAPTTSATTTDATLTDATSDDTATGPSTTTTGETTTTDTTSTTGDMTGTTADTTGGDGFLPACAELGASDEFDLVAAQIVGDELVVEVGYGGGCETHDFTLCLDSLDPNTNFSNLAIDHDAHGDACEAFIMEERKFDLTPLQQAGPSPFEFFLVGFPNDGFVYEF